MGTKAFTEAAARIVASKNFIVDIFIFLVCKVDLMRLCRAMLVLLSFY